MFGAPNSALYSASIPTTNTPEKISGLDSQTKDAIEKGTDAAKKYYFLLKKKKKKNENFFYSLLFLDCRKLSTLMTRLVNEPSNGM